MKKSLLILFGGESREHEISCISGYNVINAVDTQVYDIITVGITKGGKWLLYEADREYIKDASWPAHSSGEVALTLNKEKPGIFVLEESHTRFVEINLCFPVLHGKNGEDGTVQSALGLTGIPYVGAGVLSSALCMDKAMAKQILEGRQIPSTPYRFIKKKDLKYLDKFIDETERELGYPCFVKPANAGSSIGASKAEDSAELEKAVKNAFLYDDKVLAEKYINCREIEVAVLGNDCLRIAGPGEIVSESEFYDYDTKYISNQNVGYLIPADISDKQSNMIMRYAQTAYEALDIKGLARIDFFIDRDTGDIYLNEVNTIPGFTNISMYSKLFVSEGMTYEEVVAELLDLAI